MRAGELVQQGLGHHRNGELNEAELCYEAALEVEPGQADALHFLGMAKFQQGEMMAAEDLVRQSLDRKPSAPSYHYNLGQFLENQGRLLEALESYDVALSLDPRLAEGHNNRGNILLQLGRERQAETAFREALAINPDLAEARANLGQLLRQQGDLPTALEELTLAIRSDPGMLAAHANRMDLLRDMARPEEVLEAYQQAQAAGLDHPFLENLHIGAEQDLGDLESARARARSLLERYPQNFQALYNLAQLADGQEAPFPIGTAEDLFRRVDLDPEGRSLLAFAMGKFFDKKKDFDQAFLYWLEANQMEGRADSESVRENKNYWAAIREVFTPTLIEELSEWGDPEASPIFVVGTPRSGTTLVEQILASHPRVAGVGESGLVQDVLRDFLVEELGAEENLWGNYLTPQRCSELARAYMTKLRSLAPDADRIVDKTPGNAQNLGLIRALFPNARVVLCERDPLDSGVSMFSIRFGRSVDFAFDLETLGEHLASFWEHTAYWQRTLPEDFLLTMPYEELVAAPDQQIGRLLAHCGLEPEPECLEFFKTQRVVRTASQAQVRKPIYGSAVGRWRRYSSHLLPLARALGPEAEKKVRAETDTPFRSFSRLGERQLKEGRYQLAVASLRRALMWEPERRGELNRVLGEALEHVERYREAASAFAMARDLDEANGPGNRSEELLLAEVRCLRKGMDVANLRQALAHQPKGVGGPWLVERSWLDLFEGRITDAEEGFRSAVETGVDSDDLWEGLARAQEEIAGGEGVLEVLAEWEKACGSARAAAYKARLAAKQGAFPAAEEWAQKASLRNPGGPEGLVAMARLRMAQDRLQEAVQLLEEVGEGWPAHVPAYLELARVRLREEQAQAAREAARGAFFHRPADADTKSMLGRARFQSGETEEGLGLLREVREEHPEKARHWLEEAQALEELGRRSEAVELVDSALEQFPEDPHLRFLRIRILRQEGAEAAALEGLQDLEAEMAQIPAFQVELGYLYDRRGEPDRAYPYFHEANRKFSERGAVRRYRKEVALSRIARLRETFTTDWVANWQADPVPSGWPRPPVFLVGFPRSGTTLLDQVLTSHPLIEVIEEKPTFPVVQEALRERFGGDLQGMMVAQEKDLREFQELYREALEEFREDPQAEILVDKLPLRSVEAGMIYRLFPDARFIFARRHPADCVLSAFMQLFAPNASMANFHTLADGANFYAEVVGLWDQYRRLFPEMHVHEVRYEELVSDFDGVVDPLLSFLGLEWSDKVRAYRETALHRGRIRTPSRTQVVQPLYTHARYRWRGYREHFGEAWENLVPFIRQAGYPEE